MADDYVSEPEMRSFLKDDTTLDADSINSAITTASRAIDTMTNRPAGAFLPSSTATAKYFHVGCPTECTLVADDVIWEFSTVSGLVVEIDQNGDGVYETTLTNDTHFYLNPSNGARFGVSGWPYDELQILALSGLSFPRSIHGYREPVKITAKWGWATTPEQVKFATKLATNRYYGRSNARYGTQGFDAAGFAMRIRSDPDILALLEPFIPASRMVA